jgi:hypothetical protein
VESLLLLNESLSEKSLTRSLEKSSIFSSAGAKQRTRIEWEARIAALAARLN